MWGHRRGIICGCWLHVIGPVIRSVQLDASTIARNLLDAGECDLPRDRRLTVRQARTEPAAWGLEGFRWLGDESNSSISARQSRGKSKSLSLDGEHLGDASASLQYKWSVGSSDPPRIRLKP
jgi:hypothetical protein